MSNPVNTDKIYFFLSRHHQKARDILHAHIKVLSDDGVNHDQVAANCIALITMATCYLECRISEFWLMILNNGTDSCNLTDYQKKQFTEIAARSDWEKNSILDKYQLALETPRLPIFNKGSSPYQDAETLGLLRNELVHNVHYEVEFFEGDRLSKRPKLEARLCTLIGDCPM